MNKSLLEILEEEKRVLRNVKSLKDLRDGILEMAKSEIVESKIQSCFRIAKNYEKKLEKEEEKSQETLPQSSEQTNGQTPQETAQSAGSLSSSESITAQHEPSSSDKNQQS